MRKLLDDKKAIFYLLVSSIFIAVMIVVFLAYKEYAYTDKQKVVETRIRTINDFIKSMDTDSERVIFISGFRSLIALEDYVARTGHYLDNSAEYFRLAFYNGTVNGTRVDLLVNSSYYDYLVKLRIIAGRMGMSIDVNVTNITLYQESPWSITVNVTAQINLTDQKGLARWDFSKVYNTSVSILSIRDPVYSVATSGRVPNTIRITNITDFVASDNDTSNLMFHISYSYYNASALAPNFLMRLEGRLNESSACCGIESFVNVPDLRTQGVVYDASKSIIDYILFSNVTGYDNVSCARNTTDWFKIDQNHSVKYEVDGLLYHC